MDLHLQNLCLYMYGKLAWSRLRSNDQHALLQLIHFSKSSTRLNSVVKVIQNPKEDYICNNFKFSILAGVPEDALGRICRMTAKSMSAICPPLLTTKP